MSDQLDLFDRRNHMPSGLDLIDLAPVSDVYALVSGGKDSMAALAVAMKSPKFRGAIHINTGVGVEATRKYVRETCRDARCPLLEYCATDVCKADGTPDPQVYESIVLEHGFPGPTKFGHGRMYIRLKERPLRMFTRQHNYGARQPVGFVTGVRSLESSRRMGFVEPIQRLPQDKQWVWIAAIHDYDVPDCHREREAAGFPENPVARELCKSGECYCGGFGTEGELEELTLYDFSRDFGNYMLDLQSRVFREMKRKFGFGWLWHERKPKSLTKDSPGQLHLPGVMCYSCQAAQDSLDENDR